MSCYTLYYINHYTTNVVYNVQCDKMENSGRHEYLYMPLISLNLMLASTCK